MKVLGINGAFGGGYQDACAALLINGKIACAIEEERLTGVKFSPGTLPVNAVHKILDLYKISIHEIDAVAFHGASWKGNIKEQLATLFQHWWGYCPPIFLYFHHDAHAYSSFYSSPWDEALVITMDNSGDGISTQVMIASRSEGLKLLRQFKRPQSIGTYYGAMTQLAGFKRDSDEYKLMGLAPFGDPLSINLSNFIDYDGSGGYLLHEGMICEIGSGTPFPNKQIPLYSPRIKDNLLGNITPGSMFKHQQLRANIAASTQYQLEKVVCEMARFWIKKTGLKKICLGGGVAFNCVLNQKILGLEEVESIFVPPFAGDQGISVGTAMMASQQNKIIPLPLSTPYLGLSYNDSEIESILSASGVMYKKIKEPEQMAAKLIHAGKIIAWFQGASEIGPRALGNRSILASPLIPGTKDRINQRVKFRENFRPLCPSVLKEDFSIYFDSKKSDLPFMNITVNVKAHYRKTIPEVTHVDGTARVQTVCKNTNPKFYELLSNLKHLSGHGIVINTSFNVRSHPMVDNPFQAIECYFSSGLDALFIGSFLLEK